MPRLSIVIPCRHDLPDFEDTLASVLQNRPPDSEIIVVHPFRYADPYQLGGEVTFIEVGSTASHTELINAGIKVARGEVLHLMQCGLEVEENWTEAPMRHFDDFRVGSVSPVVVDRGDRQTIVAAGMSYEVGGGLAPAVADSAAPLPGRIVGPNWGTGFYRRDALAALGGFSEQVGHLAGVDTALSLSALGYSAALEPHSRLYGPALAGSNADGRLQVFEEGRFAERVFWRHAASAGWIRSLLLHPLAVTRDCRSCQSLSSLLLRLAGRAAACVEIARHCSFQTHLHALARSSGGIHDRCRPSAPDAGSKSSALRQVA